MGADIQLYSFFTLGTRWVCGVNPTPQLLYPQEAPDGCVVNPTPQLLYPQEGHNTPCTGGWVDPRAGMDACRISYPNPDSFPRPL